MPSCTNPVHGELPARHEKEAAAHPSSRGQVHVCVTQEIQEWVVHIDHETIFLAERFQVMFCCLGSCIFCCISAVVQQAPETMSEGCSWSSETALADVDQQLKQRFPLVLTPPRVATIDPEAGSCLGIGQTQKEY